LSVSPLLDDTAIDLMKLTITAGDRPGIQRYRFRKAQAQMLFQISTVCGLPCAQYSLARRYFTVAGKQRAGAQAGIGQCPARIATSTFAQSD
jgi:hypothetical protein